MDNSSANSNKVQTQPWTEFFFDEHNIVNTLQCLLIETSRTIEDLNELCVAMIENNVVFCLTHRGLLPIASKHMYIFPYEKMNKQQLQALRSESKNTHQTFAALYNHDKCPDVVVLCVENSNDVHFHLRTLPIHLFGLDLPTR